MTKFRAKVKIKEVLDGSKTFFGKFFTKCIVDAGSMELTAYIEEDCGKIEKNAVIESDEVYFTGKLDYLDSLHPILRICNWKLAPQPKTSDMFVIKVEGVLCKSKKAVLKNVGKHGIPFIATSLGITNENDKVYKIMLVAFNKNAIKVNDFGNNQEVTVTARLVHSKESSGYELNVVNIDAIY